MTNGSQYTYWCAKPPKKQQRCFTDLTKALKYVSTSTKLCQKRLKTGKRAKNCNDLRKRLQVFATVYKNCKELPGDVASLKKCAVRSFAIFRREPAVLVLLVQGKYSAFHDALIAAAVSEEQKGSRSNGSKFSHQASLRCCSKSTVRSSEVILARRATSLLTILRCAAKASSGKDYTAWIANCGRNVSHHAGFVHLLRKYFVIRKLKTKLPDPQVLKFGSNQRYVLCNNLTAEKKSIQKLMLLIKFADAAMVNLFKVPGPTSCAQWCDIWHRLVAVAQQHPAPGLGIGRDTSRLKYHPAWTLRALVLSRMFQQGIDELKLDCTSVHAFAACFPDQKDMVVRLQGHRRDQEDRASTMQKLYSRLHLVLVTRLGFFVV